jgi:hypothetical protein
VVGSWIKAMGKMTGRVSVLRAESLIIVHRQDKGGRLNISTGRTNRNRPDGADTSLRGSTNIKGARRDLNAALVKRLNDGNPTRIGV